MLSLWHSGRVQIGWFWCVVRNYGVDSGLGLGSESGVRGLGAGAGAGLSLNITSPFPLLHPPGSPGCTGFAQGHILVRCWAGLLIFCPSVPGSNRRVKCLHGHWLLQIQLNPSQALWGASVVMYCSFHSPIWEVLLAPFFLGSPRFWHRTDPWGHSVDTCGFIQDWVQASISPMCTLLAGWWGLPGTLH